MNNQLSAMNN